MMDILDKKYMGQNILTVIFIIYLILGYNTPLPIAKLVDTVPGKIIVIVFAIILFAMSNPILGVVGLFVAFDLIRRSNLATGSYGIQHYLPDEESKMAKISSFNEYPVTLEQEMVAKMVPVINKNNLSTKSTYTSSTDYTYDAAPANFK